MDTCCVAWDDGPPSIVFGWRCGKCQRPNAVHRTVCPGANHTGCGHLRCDRAATREELARYLPAVDGWEILHDEAEDIRRQLAAMDNPC